MNYYERHIGDYLKDTAHLSLLEHGVYGRMLDVYYTREAPIPAAQVERLIGVRSKEEREALLNVVAEFFQVDGDVLLHGRCDREIERYQLKQRKASASANARWSKGGAHSEGNANADAKAMRTHMRTHSEGNANADARAMRTHMRTHSEGNAPSNQTPDTSNQNQGAFVERQEGGPVGPAHAGFENLDAGSGPGAAAAEAMRAAGLGDVSATHPKLLALVAAGLTVAELVAAARYAADRGKGFVYALSRAEGQRRDAAAMAALPDVPSVGAADPDSRAAIEADAVRLGLPAWQQVDAQGRTVSWLQWADGVRRARADGVAA
jgi:uncharacterized protein YdaU (DUF1376 family)